MTISSLQEWRAGWTQCDKVAWVAPSGSGRWHIPALLFETSPPSVWVDHLPPSTVARPTLSLCDPLPSVVKARERKGFVHTGIYMTAFPIMYLIF